MTLPSSGVITARMINVELGRAETAPFSITGTEERELAGKPTGAISFSDFYGKSALKAIYWSGARPYTVGGSTYESTSLAFVVNGNVIWVVEGRGVGENGVAGRWTERPPESLFAEVQIKATVVSGTGTSYDWQSLPLTIGVNPSTSSSVTWKIEMRMGTGEVQDTFNVTLRKS